MIYGKNVGENKKEKEKGKGRQIEGERVRERIKKWVGSEQCFPKWGRF